MHPTYFLGLVTGALFPVAAIAMLLRVRLKNPVAVPLLAAVLFWFGIDGLALWDAPAWGLAGACLLAGGVWMPFFAWLERRRRRRRASAAAVPPQAA